MSTSVGGKSWRGSCVAPWANDGERPILDDLTDVQPLVDNTGLGPGDQVFLMNTNVSCTDVPALEAKGVEVDSDCP